MKSWAVSAVIGVAVFTCLISDACGQESSDKMFRPLVSIVKPVYEFAPVVAGEIVKHEFIVENKGKAELDILGVKTD